MCAALCIYSIILFCPFESVMRTFFHGNLVQFGRVHVFECPVFEGQVFE